MKNTFLFWALLIVSAATAQPQTAFTLTEKDLIPEGITYDESTRRFFLGSIAKRKIVQIDPAGRATDFVSSRQHDLGEVLGMKVDTKRKRLIAVSNDGEANPNGRAMIHAFNLDGTLQKKLSLAAQGEVRLFNDLIITEDGGVFITDSDGSAIYYVDPAFEKIELWLKSDELRYANGITLSPDEKTAIVSTGRGFVSVDLTTKGIRPLPFADYYVIGVDGLYTYGKSLIAIQNVTYPTSIARYELDEQRVRIARAKLLLVDDPGFDLPTTGVVVGNWFYYIANTQLRQFKDGKLVAPEKLKDIVIARIKLN